MARSSTPRSGSRAKANSTSTSSGERRHLAGRHPAAGLDAQVAPGHERGVTPHGRHLGPGSPRRRPPRPAPAGGRPPPARRRGGMPPRSCRRPGRRPGRPGTRPGRARGEDSMHGGPLRRPPGAISPSSRSRASASSPAWGSSSSHSSGRRASRQASEVRAALAGGQPGDGDVAEPAVEADHGQRGLDVGRVGPGGPAPEAHVLGRPSGRRTEPVAWPSRPTRRRTPGDRGAGRGRARRPRPARRAPGPRRRAAASSCLRRSGRGGGRSRRAPRRGRRRRAQGTARAARRQRGSGRPAP